MGAACGSVCRAAFLPPAVMCQRWIDSIKWKRMAMPTGIRKKGDAIRRLTRPFATAFNYKYPENYSTTDLISKRRLFARGFFLLCQTKHPHPRTGSGSRRPFRLLGLGRRNFVAASGANVLVRLNSKLTTRTQVVQHISRPLSLIRV